MSTSSSYVPCHSQVDPVYFETSNDVRMQQECSTFSETSSIQNTPSSDLVKVELQDSELWKKFHHLTNEMIVNKQGRCMFPIYRVKLFNLKPDAIYNVWMDIVNTDGQRYRRQKNQWTVVGPGKSPVQHSFYLHPLSPFSGKTLMNQLVSFDKVKLTNSFSKQLSAEKFYVHSQHHYQPWLYISRVDKQSELQLEPTSTFAFDETSFITVTTYQNKQVSQLKIYSNPYACGFRLGGGNDVRKRKVQEMDDQTPSPSQGSNQNVFNNSASKRLKQQSCEVNTPSICQTADAIFTPEIPQLPTCSWIDDPILPQQNVSSVSKVSGGTTLQPEVNFIQSNPAEQQIGGNVGNDPLKVFNDPSFSQQQIQTDVQFTSCPSIAGGQGNEYHGLSSHCQQQSNWQNGSICTSSSAFCVADPSVTSCTIAARNELPVVAAGHSNRRIFPEVSLSGSTIPQIANQGLIHNTFPVDNIGDCTSFDHVDNHSRMFDEGRHLRYQEESIVYR